MERVELKKTSGDNKIAGKRKKRKREENSFDNPSSKTGGSQSLPLSLSLYLSLFPPSLSPSLSPSPSLSLSSPLIVIPRIAGTCNRRLTSSNDFAEAAESSSSLTR